MRFHHWVSCAVHSQSFALYAYSAVQNDTAAPNTSGVIHATISIPDSVLNTNNQALIVGMTQKYLPSSDKNLVGKYMDGLSFTQPAYSFFANRETLSGNLFPYKINHIASLQKFFCNYKG